MISLSLPVATLEAIDEAVATGRVASRTAAVVAAVEEWLSSRRSAG